MSVIISLPNLSLGGDSYYVTSCTHATFFLDVFALHFPKRSLRRVSSQ